MVDQLTPAQLEALYVLLHSMMGRLGGAIPSETAAAAVVGAASPFAAAGHRFPFIGIMDGEPDLAERSAQILREELGNPSTRSSPGGYGLGLDSGRRPGGGRRLTTTRPGGMPGSREPDSPVLGRSYAVTVPSTGSAFCGGVRSWAASCS